MTTQPLDSPEDRRLEQAADWAVRLNDADTPVDDIVAWMSWCDADPRNRAAFDKIDALWKRSSELEPSLPPVPARPRRRWTNRWRVVLAPSPRAVAWFASGTSVAALVVAITLIRPLSPEASVPAVTLEQPREFVRQTQLADGSSMQLATGSKVAIRYTRQERALELQSGQAYFDVVPDRTRPFVVAAGASRIRAVGTAFDVRRSGERVRVTVVEGIVEVSRSGTQDPVEIHAGSSLSWGGPDDAPVLTAVNPAAALDWRQGRLAYSDEPLEAVIADFNRYAERPARIDDEQVRGLRFSGTLFARDTREWLYSLPQTLPVELRNEGDVWLILPRERPVSPN